MHQNSLYKSCSKLIILICFFVALSCDDNSKSDTNKSKEKSLKLVEEETIAFPLDKETNHNLSVKINRTNDSSFLSFFNPNNNSIYIYDYDSKSLKKRVQLNREGPNGIKLGGQLFPSYFVHTLDSIFLTGSINHYLINNNGEVLVKGSINNNTSGMGTLEDKVLSFDKATYFNNGNIYSGITSYSLDNKPTDLRAIIPLPLNTVSSTYLKKDILIHNYDEVTKIKAELLNGDVRIMAVMGLSFARNKAYLYASTPISDTLYIFKNEKIINKVYTGTDKIKMSDTRTYFDQFNSKTYHKSMEHPFYKGLFSDTNDDSNFLYRIVSNGNRKVYNENTKQDELKSKGAYLIVIDLNTNTTTYLDLPTDTINLNSWFVVNGKIHFKLKTQDNENEMVFKTFRVE